MTSATKEQRRLLYEQLIGAELAQKYTVTGLLGFGGMGAVYEALQRPMGRTVALKLIPTYDPMAAARFEREALTVSRLAHPNTVTVFDYGQTGDGHLFLTMEHLKGRTLTELIRSEGPLPPARAVHITEQICRALGEAHGQGIIHRDIKPDNIFLIQVDRDPDYVKVLDFGIAKAIQGEDDASLTAEGRIVGTPRYMSPEQIMATQVDHRSDLYSVGCILYEMLCGVPPFDQQGTAALMMSHAQQQPPPFRERLSDERLRQIPGALESVVRRVMAKRPDDRPYDTEALRLELADAQRISAPAYTASPGNPPGSWSPPPRDPTGPSTRPELSPPMPLEHHTGDFSRQTGEQLGGQHAGLALPAPQRAAAATATRESAVSWQMPAEPHRVEGMLAAAHARAMTRRLAVPIALIVVCLLGGSSLLFRAMGAEDEARDVAPNAPMIADQRAPALTHIRLVSSPPGATVTLEQVEVGKTPLAIPVEALHTAQLYRMELEGYQAAAVEVDPAHLNPSYAIALNAAPPGVTGHSPGSATTTPEPEVERDTPRRLKVRPLASRKGRRDHDSARRRVIELEPEPKPRPAVNTDPPQRVTPRVIKLDDEDDVRPHVERLPD